MREEVVNEVLVRHRNVTVTISEDEATIDEVRDAVIQAVKGLGYNSELVDEVFGA